MTEGITTSISKITFGSLAQYNERFADEPQPLDQPWAIDDLHTRYVDLTGHTRYDIKYDDVSIKGYVPSVSSYTYTVTLPVALKEGSEFVHTTSFRQDSTSSTDPPHVKTLVKSAPGDITGITFYVPNNVPFYYEVTGVIAEIEENA